MNQKLDQEKKGQQTKYIQKDRTSQKTQLFSKEVVKSHLSGIKQEIAWLGKVIKLRMAEYQTLLTTPETELQSIDEACPPPELTEGTYRDFILEQEYSYVERLVLILALATDFTPKIVQKLFNYSIADGDENHPFGGYKPQDSKRYTPTLETAIFLLSGDDYDLKAYYMSLLKEHHPLFKKQIVDLQHTTDDPMLILSQEHRDYFFTGTKPRLDQGENFPAELEETDKIPEDLVVSEKLQEQLNNLRTFIAHQESIVADKDTRRKYTHGNVVMFYGPPGTGKTMTAKLIAKECGIPLYRIDLSKVISKYIGETEKNLERVFARLEGKNVILFFDEADALFGKRTEISDAKDRYANQEISYLLQRVEKWHGVVFLATNYQQNLDAAFSRRIEKEIFFEPPVYEERLRLWNSLLAERLTYEPENLPEILAGAYPFTGANIATVLKHAYIEAMSQGTTKITKEILNPLIREECNRNGMRQTYVQL